MEEETTNKLAPPPLRGSATLHGGLRGSISVTVQLAPLPKPPWHERMMKRNLKAAKIVFVWAQAGKFIFDLLPSPIQDAVRDVAQSLLSPFLSRRHQSRQLNTSVSLRYNGQPDAWVKRDIIPLRKARKARAAVPRLRQEWPSDSQSNTLSH